MLQDLVACNFKVDIKKFDVLYVRDPYLNGSAKYIAANHRACQKI